VVGCGGFGKGNFGELFKSIEEYEKQIDASRGDEIVNNEEEGKDESSS